MQQIYRGTSMTKCDFNKVTKFIEITLRHGFSPVDLLNISEHLFLETPLAGCFCIHYCRIFAHEFQSKKVEQINKRYRRIVLNDFKSHYETLLKNCNKSV